MFAVVAADADDLSWAHLGAVIEAVIGKSCGFSEVAAESAALYGSCLVVTGSSVLSDPQSTIHDPRSSIELPNLHQDIAPAANQPLRGRKTLDQASAVTLRYHARVGDDHHAAVR